MPKYYVRDGYEKAVVEANSELGAIVKCVMHSFDTFIVNGFYKVSERGFEDHSDDSIINSNDVLDIIIDIIEKNKKKDEDSP